MQPTLKKFFQSEKKNNMPEGLIVIENFITPEEENTLLKETCLMNWDNTLSRRTQHYGYKYNYKSRSINNEDYLGSLPEFTNFVIDRMIEQNLINKRPEQLIINEYTPGQGIAAHIDASVFGDPVISLSAGSHCIFTFTKKLNDKEEVYDLLLKPRTLVIMSGESRYKWKHSIAGKKSDKTHEGVMKRGTRISYTFRTLV